MNIFKCLHNFSAQKTSCIEMPLKWAWNQEWWYRLGSAATQETEGGDSWLYGKPRQFSEILFENKDCLIGLEIQGSGRGLAFHVLWSLWSLFYCKRKHTSVTIFQTSKITLPLHSSTKSQLHPLYFHLLETMHHFII